MAVSGMKKLSAVTPIEETDSLLYALQRLRCVELQTETGQSPPETDTGRLTAAIGQAREAIDFLSGYGKKTRGLFASPVERDWNRDWPEGETTADAAVMLAERMTKLRSGLTNVRILQEGLLPWKMYGGALPESRTKFTKTICGLLPAGADLTALEAALEPYACVMEEILQPDGTESSPKQDKN